MFKIIWSDNAYKQLNKLPRLISKRVHQKVGLLKDDPFALNIKRLAGMPFYQLRIGDYRVIFDIQNKELIILVIKVGHRSTVYNK